MAAVPAQKLSGDTFTETETKLEPALEGIASSEALNGSD
jgi:hypothetical protein